MPDIWALAVIATKFALYLGVLTSAGTVFAVMFFELRFGRRFAIAFAILGVLGTALGFFLSGAMLTGDISGMTDPEMLGLLWSTSVGTSVIIRLAGLCLIMAGLALGHRWIALSAVGAMVALWSFVHVGHVADRVSLVLSALLMFHLFAVSVWIGILSPLRRLAMVPDLLGQAGDVAHRFGKIAMVLVPLLIVAGGYLGFVLVGSWSGLFSSGYGQALLLKMVLVAGLLMLAAVNKLRFVPRMQHGDPAAGQQLAKSITIEWALIIAVLLVTATLTTGLTLPS